MAIGHTLHTGTQDFNGDGHYDFLWKGADGSHVIWNMSADGRQITGGTFIPNPDPSGNFWSLVLTGNFNGDRTTDLLWQGKDGTLISWIVTNNQIANSSVIGAPGTGRTLITEGDFNADGKDELLWYGSGGNKHITDSDGATAPRPGTGVIPLYSLDFSLRGIGDFNGDGKEDLISKGGSSRFHEVYMIEEINGEPRTDGSSSATSKATFFRNPGEFWSVSHIADFNGDKHADIFWQGSDGTPVIWLMNGTNIIGGGFLHNPGDFWTPIDARDYNSDGKADILWQGKDGVLVEWLMDGSQFLAIGAWIPNPGAFWSVDVL